MIWDIKRETYTLRYFVRIDVKAGRKDFYLVTDPESSNC